MYAWPTSCRVRRKIVAIAVRPIIMHTMYESTAIDFIFNVPTFKWISVCKLSTARDLCSIDRLVKRLYSYSNLELSTCWI